MRVGLTVARFAAAAWVGAALLFVVTAVREVRNPGFDSATKDALALMRFPAYYVFGFTLVTLALVAGLGSYCLRPRGGRRICVAAGLLAMALIVMGIDFVSVYRPMAEMITPPGWAHPAEFRTYHRASVWLNVGHVGLCALAALFLCWPEPLVRAEHSDIAAAGGVE
jgi:hypothetical protein